MVIPEGDANIVLEQLGSDQLLLRVKKPGDALVRVRWTPYWLAKGGCVERDGDWTRVTATKAGYLRLVTRFGPERVFQRGRAATACSRCAHTHPARPGAPCTLSGRAAGVTGLSLAVPPGLVFQQSLAAPGLAGRAAPAAAVRRRVLRLPPGARTGRRPGGAGVRERPHAGGRRSAAWACSSSRACRTGPRPTRSGSVDAANFMYVNSHFVITTTFLIWLYIFRNPSFYYVRNMFMIAMFLALVGYVAYPTAPPRFMPEWGFTDTVAASSWARTPSRAPTCSTTRSPPCPACTWRSR